MTATMWGATLTVEIDFDNGPYTAMASRSWTDVTADVRSWSVTRGRTTELAQYAPGTLSLTLANRDRLYDPSNTGGSYVNKLLPRRCVRVRLAAGAVATTTIFTGYIQGWPQEYPADGMDSVCVVTAVDAFDVFATRSLPGSAYGAEVLADDPINYWPMQEPAGAVAWVDVADPTADLPIVQPSSYPAAVSSSSHPVGQATYQEGFGATAATSLTTPAAIEFWISSDAVTGLSGEVVRAASSTDFFTVKVVTTTDALSQKSSKVQVRYSHGGKTDSLAGGSNITFPLPPDGVWHVCVTADSTYLKAYINGQLVGTDTLAAGSYSYGVVSRAAIYTQAAGGVPLAHVACYSTAPSAARILAHYEAGLHAFGHPYGDRAGSRIGRILDAIDWPSADRDLSTGSTVLDQWLPNGTALAACREVETAEQGAFFISAAGKPTLRSRGDFFTTTRCATSQATFGDQAGEINYTNPLRIDGNHIDYLRNIVTVTYGQDSSAVTTQDATSRAAYGDLDDSVAATLLPSYDGWLARQFAAFRLRLRKTPTSRVGAVTIDPSAVTARLEALIPLELCDRVTVNRRPTGGSGSFSQECHVQGVRWSGDARNGFTWQGYLAPAIPSAVAANYFVTANADRGIIGPAHLALTGTSGDYASTPDAAALDITGDIELVCRARATDWTPAGGLDFGAKWGGTQQSWQWSHMPAGTMRFRYSPDGTTTNSDTSTTAMTATDGTYYWVKVTLDVDNGAAGRDVKFYTAADSATEPTSWTQLGTTVTTAGTTSIFSGTSVLAIGSASNGSGNMFNGSIARFIVRSGIGGTIVFDFDATEFATHGQTTVTEQSSNAATVTINGNARAHPANVFPY